MNWLSSWCSIPQYLSLLLFTELIKHGNVVSSKFMVCTLWFACITYNTSPFVVSSTVPYRTVRRGDADEIIATLLRMTVIWSIFIKTTGWHSEWEWCEQVQRIIKTGQRNAVKSKALHGLKKRSDLCSGCFFYQKPILISYKKLMDISSFYPEQNTNAILRWNIAVITKARWVSWNSRLLGIFSMLLLLSSFESLMGTLVDRW